ncbi:MAG TPA: phospholipid carrier-dependent glycosyltransferase [Dongiaceae bacterium]|nr:phospholipid carrier-dependent glycosyltransferase [Dongiaceae bacterium]
MTSQPSPASLASPAQRRAWAALVVVVLAVCYFAQLGIVGFAGPDEPRYAWIARDMAESGDWVTPRLYGQPWFEKPVLLYWGGAIFFRLFPGHPEIAARLPSAISALLATLALAWFARRVYGGDCARWLLLLLPATVGMIAFSHAAATDMPFAGMLTVAMVCAAVAIGLARNHNTPVLPRTPWFALLLFGFFLGLAMLAKGPAAIILCGGAVFFWAIFTRRWRDTFRLLHPAAIAAFCATALPWYILCARRNPDFFRVFIIEHNFKRYLTPEFQHIQPFWFYLPILLIAFLPWTLLLPWSAYAALSGGRHEFRPAPTTVLLLCWSGFCLIFFSISKSKLPGYILPAVPALALLLVRLIQIRLPKPRVVGLSFVVPVLIAILSVQIFLPRVLRRDPSAKTVATEVASAGAAQNLFVANMHRAQHYSLNFYLHREIPDWDSNRPQEGYLLLPGKNCGALVAAPYTCSSDPRFLGKSQYYLYRVTNETSLGGLGGAGGRGRQP